MAMRYGHRICTHVRINKFSGVPTSLRVRSYFSGVQSQFSEGSPSAFNIAIVATPFAVLGNLWYKYDVSGLRAMITDWMAENKAQEMRERLNREKFESEVAYLEMLDREANALKKKVLDRECDLRDVMIYQREAAALKGMVEIRPAKENNTPQAA